MARARSILATVLVAFAFALGLSACGNAAPEEAAAGDDAQIAATTAQTYLNLASETGSAWAVSSWSIAGEGWKTEVTNTYDSAGNLTSQETVGTQPNTMTSQTLHYTYDKNALVSREAEMRLGDVASTIALSYAQPSYTSADGEDVLSYTGTGTDETSGIAYEWETSYHLADNGTTLAEVAEQSTVSVPGAEGEDGSAGEPTEIATSQATDFDSSGRATHAENTITGATLTLELAYGEDRLDVSGDVSETWSIQENDQGLITQAERGDGVVISIAYAELPTPTNFSRALARCSGGQALVNALTLSLATGLLG